MHQVGLVVTKSIVSKNVDEKDDGFVVAAAVSVTIPSMVLFGNQQAVRVVLVVVVGDVSAVSYYWNGSAMTLWSWIRRSKLKAVLESGVHSPGFGQDTDGMRSASVLGMVMRRKAMFEKP